MQVFSLKIHAHLARICEYKCQLELIDKNLNRTAAPSGVDTGVSSSGHNPSASALSAAALPEVTGADDGQSE
jgi:hypothetical protein